MKTNILITGGTGFLGSHIATNLVHSGYSVHILARKSSNLCRIEPILNQVTLHRIEKEIENIFTETQYKAIIHTATCYGREENNLTEFINSNIYFPLQILQASIKHNKDTLFINSDTYFPKNLNAYSLSKKHFLEWGKALTNLGGLRFYNIKIEHLFGPGDSEDKFIPSIIKNCINNVSEIKLTPGEQKRDFIYIDDAVEAYKCILESEIHPVFEEIELGTGYTLSIRDIVSQIHSLTNSRTKLLFSAYPYRPNEIMVSKADIKKLQKLGWTPKTKISDGLKNIIREYIEKGNSI